MPDGDVISRGYPRHWRGMLELVRGGHDDLTCATRIVRTLAKRLRDTGGLPSLQVGLRILADLREGIISRIAALERARDLECAAGSNDVYLTAPLMRFIGAGDETSVSDAQFARACLDEMVRNEFSARLESLPLDSVYHTRAEFQSHVKGIEIAGAPALQTLADQLAADPNARNLRAPRQAAGSFSAKSWLEGRVE